jgi:hypothetical protein
VHYRYRQPTRAFACGLCVRGFDKRFLIRWTRREITAAARRQAAAATVSTSSTTDYSGQTSGQGAATR